MTESHTYTEHCGVIATIGTDISSEDFLKGWRRLRHRGDDSLGLLTTLGNEVSQDHVQKSGGDDYPHETLNNSHDESSLRVGHNRYITSGIASQANMQPLLLQDEQYLLGLAHNGNIPTEALAVLRSRLNDPLPPEASDSRIMAALLLQYRKDHETWEDTFIATLPLFQGSYALACMTDEQTLYAIRDPWGIRPLCIGKKGESWVVTSESVALDTIGASLVREVRAGELIAITRDGTLTSTQFATMEKGPWFCLLEMIYFSKIDSMRDGKSIKLHRQALGRAVGERFKQKAIPVDYVIPILNSGKQMSIGVSQALEMHNTEAIQISTDHRSFIQNTPASRTELVNRKHVVDGTYIEGKRILLCDDSIVRGTSLLALLAKIKEHHPSEIHIVLGSEPVVDICDLGVDLPTQGELLVHQLTPEQPRWENPEEYMAWLVAVEHLVAARLGVDSVTYLDREALNRALELTDATICRHCFGGEHPVREQQPPVYLVREKRDKKNV